MDIQLLKMQIESACADGKITTEEYARLQEQAKLAGIEPKDFNILIENAIEKNKHRHEAESGFLTFPKDSSDKSSSGFITTEEGNTPKNHVVLEKSSSGFITTEEENRPKNHVVPDKVQSEFTEVTTLTTQGAMGMVQKGKLHGKWIIIKRINPKFRDDPKYEELFFTEFENTYFLDHENIVRIYGKGEDKDGVYYTMEYIDGQPLSKIIQNKQIQKSQNPESTALRYFKQMLNAFSYVHSKQIYHRDLKPDNILITHKGDNVKIIDFGLALTDSFDDDMKKVGTPIYASPEQLTDGKNIDQRADIYSLGLIFLEMLTQSTEPKDVKKIKNKAFKKIIKKCLMEKPEERFFDCDEIIKELENTKKSKTALWVALGVVLVLIISGAGLYMGGFFGETKTRAVEKREVKKEGSVSDNKSTEKREAKEESLVSGNKSTEKREKKKRNSVSGSKSITFPNGDKYVGEVLNDKLNGEGTYTFASEQIISKNDPKKRKAQKGDYLVGKWRNGELYTGKLYNDKGERKETIIIGR